MNHKPLRRQRQTTTDPGKRVITFSSITVDQIDAPFLTSKASTVPSGDTV